MLLVNRAYKDFKSDDNGQNLLRQAISYAINRSELISSAYQNMATVAYTPDPLRHMALQRIDHPRHLRPADGRVPAGQAQATSSPTTATATRTARRWNPCACSSTTSPVPPRAPNAANKIVDQLAAVGIPAYVATWSRESVQTKLVSGDYSIAMCGFNFDVSPDPGFTLTSTASCNYTRYRSNDMNDLITQLRKSRSPPTAIKTR